MGSFDTERVRASVPAAILLLIVLLFVGACSEETKSPNRNNPPDRRLRSLKRRHSFHHRIGDDSGLVAS